MIASCTSTSMLLAPHPCPPPPPSSLVLSFAVLALTACGVGLNLSCADTACFAELCWNPATLEQAEARVHRMGQQSSHVNVYYLLGGDEEDSPDSVMFRALVKKSRAAARAVDGGQMPDDLGAVSVHYAQPRERSQPLPLLEGEGGATAAAGLASFGAAGGEPPAARSKATGKRRARDEGDAGHEGGHPLRDERDQPEPQGAARPKGPCGAAGSSSDQPMTLSDSDDDIVKAKPLLPAKITRAAPESVDKRPLCQYGSRCYRKNTQHRAEYRHDGAPRVSSYFLPKAPALNAVPEAPSEPDAMVLAPAAEPESAGSTVPEGAVSCVVDLISSDEDENPRGEIA